MRKIARKSANFVQILCRNDEPQAIFAPLGMPLPAGRLPAGGIRRILRLCARRRLYRQGRPAGGPGPAGGDRRNHRLAAERHRLQPVGLQPQFAADPLQRRRGSGAGPLLLRSPGTLRPLQGGDQRPPPRSSTSGASASPPTVSRIRSGSQRRWRPARRRKS